MSFQYNELNQVQSFTEQSTYYGSLNSNTWQYQYDTSGRLQQATLPTGQYSKMGYDNAGRLTSVQFGNGTTTSKSFAYGYDLNE